MCHMHMTTCGKKAMYSLQSSWDSNGAYLCKTLHNSYVLTNMRHVHASPQCENRVHKQVSVADLLMHSQHKSV